LQISSLYGKKAESLLARVIGEDEAERYLRIKNIDQQLTKLHFKDKILDVGCGLGIDSILLSERAAFCIGVDIDEKSLRIAKTLAKISGSTNIDFILASAFNLPFRDNVFDVSVSYSAIEHCKKNYYN